MSFSPNASKCMTYRSCAQITSDQVRSYCHKILKGTLPGEQPNVHYKAYYSSSRCLVTTRYVYKSLPERIQGLHTTNTYFNNISTTTTTTTPHHDNTGDITCTLTPVPSSTDPKGEVAHITIRNPNRLNSLNSSLITKLTTTLTSLASNLNLRCLTIQGEQSTTKTAAFSSGANIHEMSALTSSSSAKSFITNLHEACQAMRNIPVVTIAQIHGLCFGGALELVASCDFRYATRSSSFSMPETKVGIPSVIEARLLANIVGWQRMKEMVYLAKVYEAEEMRRWGLVDRVCEDTEELERVVGETVGIVTSHGPGCMRAQKKLIGIWEETGMAEGIEAGIDSFASMFEDGGVELKKYMQTFIDRKKGRS